MIYEKINYTPLLLSVLAVISMIIIDTSGHFSYFLRSFIKVILFWLIPFVYLNNKSLRTPNLKNDKHFKTILIAMLGIIVGVFLGAYILNNFGLLDNVKVSVGDKVGVSNKNYPFVFIYIVLINGPLEEFFFRYFIPDISYRFPKSISSFLFAIYHVGMLYTMFPWYIFTAAIIGLMIVGYFFQYINKEPSILNSILLHMAANFAINTVGWLLIM